MKESTTLDIIRFDRAGERISWSRVQMGSSTQLAPFKLHGHFGEGEEIWCSVLVYKDGAALIDAHRPPTHDDQSMTVPVRKAFLLYPNMKAARTAGWRL